MLAVVVNAEPFATLLPAPADLLPLPSLPVVSYIVSLYLLAKKHSSLHWTKDNGLNVPVGLLNPVEPKEEQHAPKH